MPLPSELDPVIRQAAQKYGLDEAYLRAVLMTESRGNIHAVSPRTASGGGGAQGIAQFMPDTARDMGVKDPFDPYDAIPGAARYLAQGLAVANRLGVDDPATYAARYYNGGPGFARANAPENQAYPWTVSQYYDSESKYLASNPPSLATPPGGAPPGAVPANWAQPGQSADPGLGPGSGWHPVGDSLAGGFVRYGRLPGVAVGKNAAPADYNSADTADGRQPHQVLAYLKSLGDLNGTPIILSSGVSNNPKEAGLVPEMLAELKRANAGPVALVGVGTKPSYEGGSYYDLRSYNEQLAQCAQDAKDDGQDVRFLGGIPNAVVHPAPGYYTTALGKLGAPAPAQAAAAAVSPSPVAASTEADKGVASAPVDLPAIPDTSLPMPTFALGGGG